MKLYIIPLLLLIFTASCGNSDDVNENEQENLAAQTFLNVSYAPDLQQTADIYLPANRKSATTKTIILIHGGGWSDGDKSELTPAVPTLQAQFPEFAIVNMNYRLGSAQSPGFPKQIQDIQQLIAHLKQAPYQISNEYALLGTSAGAQLALLYGYKYDNNDDIKAIISIIGPTDFTDPNYFSSPLFNTALAPLVGLHTYQNNPEIYAAASPALHVDAGSPPTAMFMGDQDPLVPATQGPLLQDKLDSFGIQHQLTMYNGGHGNWDQASLADMQQKIGTFVREVMD